MTVNGLWGILLDTLNTLNKHLATNCSIVYLGDLRFEMYYNIIRLL